MKYLILFIFSIFSFAQQTSKVDFKIMEANVAPNQFEKSISGTVSYQFKVIKSIDTIRIDAKKMKFIDVKINNKIVNYKNNNKELLLFEGFKKGKNTLTFQYTATPKQTLYFIGENDELQIWTQGQGKYTSHWLPSFDDVNEKVIFNVAVNFRNDFEVIANGELQNTSYNSKGNIKTWQYKMQKPMSSYLVMLAIGKFSKQVQKSISGIPLEMYVDSKQEAKFEPTYRYSKQIFDFLETKIGVKYPWKIYRQVPVRDFLYAGMENTSSTIFAQDFVVDSIGYNDRNYINVNAHELAHQWFGDLITAKSSKHHWLHEGFATYYALLAEKEIFGNDYFYYQLYKNAKQIKQAAKTDTIPVMNEKASSLSFYQKGALALHVVRENIGDKKFDKIIKKYLKKYQYKTVETDDFLNYVKKQSNFNVDKFKKNWLEEYRFQTNEVDSLLHKNSFISKLVEIQSYKNKSFAEKKDLFLQTIKSNVFYPAKTEIINQLQNIPFDEKKEILNTAMQNNTIEVRQQIAKTIKTIPIDFKTDFETLLNDDSYNTKEIAFQSLFTNFPEEQLNYLNKLKACNGTNDLSTRVIYLAYSQLTEQLDSSTKETLLNELLNYTTSNYESSIRQNAFESLLMLKLKNVVIIKNLLNASKHFKWQFSKFAKETLREIYKQSNSSDIQYISKLLTDDENMLLLKIIE